MQWLWVVLSDGTLPFGCGVVRLPTRGMQGSALAVWTKVVPLRGHHQPKRGLERTPALFFASRDGAVGVALGTAGEALGGCGHGL